MWLEIQPPFACVAHRSVPGRDLALHVRLALLGDAGEGPRHAQRVLVVDGHAPFEVVAGEQRVGPQADAAGGPHGIRFAHPFAQTPVDEPVVELVELQPEVPRRIRANLILEPHAPVHMHPLEVQRIDGVLLALKPVARHFREDDLDKPVLPGERLPVGHQRSRLGSEISPDQAGLGFHGIRRDADLVLEVSLRSRDVFIRLLGAAAVLVEQPAVIVAAQPALLDESVRQVGAAMRAMPVDQPVGAAQILVERQVLAQQANGLDGLVVELADRGDGHPVAAEQAAHGRPRTYLGQKVILSFVQHKRRAFNS